LVGHEPDPKRNKKDKIRHEKRKTKKTTRHRLTGGRVAAERGARHGKRVGLALADAAQRQLHLKPAVAPVRVRPQADEVEPHFAAVEADQVGFGN
jgi:hypothetical protein